MRFLEHAGLSRLSVLVKDLDVGDRLLCGRLELFSTEKRKQVDSVKVQTSSVPEKRLGSTIEPNAESLTVNKRRKIDNDLHVGYETLDATLDRQLCNENDSNNKTDDNIVKLRDEQINKNSNLQLCEHQTKNSEHLECSITTSHNEVKDSFKHTQLSETETVLMTTPKTTIYTGSNVIDSVELDELSDEISADSISCLSLKKQRSLSGTVGSVFDTHTYEEGRELLVNLVKTLNACFPDYDFSTVTPDVFIHIEDFVTVYTSINYHLSFLAERAIPGFLNDLWSTIKDVINLRSVEIYSYSNTQGKVESDPYQDDADCLFSFDYFFVDHQQQRILFFTCMTKRKDTPYGSLEYSNWNSRINSSDTDTEEYDEEDKDCSSDADEADKEENRRRRRQRDCDIDDSFNDYYEDLNDDNDDDDDDQSDELLYGEIR